VRTDYLEFSNVPNLIMPIIKDIPKCNGMLFWVLSEAQRRNALLNETATDLKLPEIFVILDDYAQVARDKEVQKTLYELLQINHRVKIHIIIVTSISLAKIISTELKVHIPHRITFFLPEKRNSKVVIDQHGAETLRVPSQFIAKFYSEAKVYDSVELSDSDIKEACNISANKPCEHNIATNNVIIQNSSYSEDELYHIAVLTVIETGGASTSILQRKLRIGYDRASKLLDRMFKNGIIGPYEVTGYDYPYFQHIFTLNSKGEAVKSYFYGIEEFTRYYERDAKGNIVKIVEYFCDEKAPYRYIIRKIKYRK
jgi:S-DNA-T family DNA segregation ATPase FtsK/SpoIIIE